MKGVDIALPKGWMAMVTTMKRVCRVPVSQVNVITSQKGWVRTGRWQCATASTLIGDDAAEDLEDHIKGSVHKFSGGIQTLPPPPFNYVILWVTPSPPYV